MSAATVVADMARVASKLIGEPVTWSHGLDGLYLHFAGRSQKIDPDAGFEPMRLALHRLLVNPESERLVAENAAEYEAAANGHRLL